MPIIDSIPMPKSEREPEAVRQVSGGSLAVRGASGAGAVPGEVQQGLRPGQVGPTAGTQI